jgi:hypothetical protein
MDWATAEATLKSFVDAQWAASTYASVPLIWENGLDDPAATFISATIEGTYTETTIFGGPGKRCVIQAGLVFFHAFTPLGSGKTLAVAMVTTLTHAIEIQAIAAGLNTDGGNPPSPIETRGFYDRGMPVQQPGGDYYRCSGSVPFVVIDTR